MRGTISYETTRQEWLGVNPNTCDANIKPLTKNSKG